MQIEVLDDHKCSLGEGPLWHPKTGDFFWFDIDKKLLLKRSGTSVEQIQFDRHVSAAGWLDEQNLLVADEFGLFQFNHLTKDETRIADIENDNPITRSNDGRADPFAGFWIGTMGKKAEPEAGAIYRYYRGEVRQLFDKISISNSICFSPDGEYAYFTDTVTKKIMRQTLDQTHGWPVGEAELFADLSGDDLNPDGSIVDANGNLWNAQWGAGRVAQYAKDGSFLRAIEFPASQVTCPAFGGENLDQLIVTSAKIGLGDKEEFAGCTFSVSLNVKGQNEHQVVL
ncbi:SMP-30/gluconolactonase/LRE family protein [uncultured Maritalea sp.]|jgi:sugar lactone lactonase YvrE|uniref:SMP-30/gluconolactonase/LRE family protein n=1 Tax=uncultured Maritalea sp. TaxID=757249 RepID=UPI0026286578|nr:SMP-30/gluconolactonase/LRE family protein [uncultured Maritalea sp.]